VHNATFFVSCIIYILYTGVLKLKKNSGAKGLKSSGPELEAACSPEALDTSSVHGTMSLTVP
jgi:hypothetical protein